MMVHGLIAIECDPTQHERLVRSIAERKYQFDQYRKGYNRVHVSEIRLYNFRCKKEVLPHFLKDLNILNLNPAKRVSLLDVIKGPGKSDKDAFFQGRISLLTSYIIQKLSKFVRIKPLEISDKDPVPFVNGWKTSFGFGKIDDIARYDMNEEL